MKVFLLVFVLFTPDLSKASKTNENTSPLNISIKLSGNFGELRRDHIHSGLDIKTKGSIGLPVKAINHGYISRIKIKPKGFGKAIYINHPNGITSVYAHLHKFYGKIATLVYSKQIKMKKNEIDLYFKPQEILIKKGEKIAYSGNSGSSYAPHLHFETRKTKNQIPLNPMNYFNIEDAKPPKIISITLYPLSDSSLINNKKEPLTLYPYISKSGIYTLKKIPKVKNSIGIGFNGFDQQGKESNKNGIYKIQILNHKNNLIFGYTFNQFSFNYSRYINAIIDYPVFITYKRRIIKCFNPNQLNIPFINKKNINNGIITLNNDKSIYTLKLSDFKSNTSIMEIPLMKDKSTKTNYQKKRPDLIINPKNNFFFNNNFIEIMLNPKSVYKEEPFIYKNSNTIKNTSFLTHHIGSNKVPLHSYNLFKIKPSLDIKEKNKKKVIVARLNYKKELEPYETKWENGWLNFKSRDFGLFAIFIDTIAPKIKLINSSTKNQINFEVIDNISEIKNYNGFVDDKWVIIDYDKKINKMTHFINTKKNGTKHDFKLIVTDMVNNKKIFSTTFIH